MPSHHRFFRVDGFRRAIAAGNERRNYGSTFRSVHVTCVRVCCGNDAVPDTMNVVSKFRVLTVCTANVCRSPAGAVMLKTGIEQAGLDGLVEVESAGTTYESEGFPMDERILTSLRRAGYTPEDHIARSVVVHQLAQWDLVLAMTVNHAKEVRRKVAALPDQDSAPAVHMWGEFDPTMPAVADPEELDVPDPWYEEQKQFDRTVRRMEQAVPSIVFYIRSRIRARGQLPSS